MLGEMAFLNHSRRSASAIARSDSELIEIDTAKFKQYLQSQPEWLKVLMVALVKRIEATTERLG